MNTLEILLQQIGLFVIYILAGMILVKTKVLNSETLDPISRFVIKMALPVIKRLFLKRSHLFRIA